MTKRILLAILSVCLAFACFAPAFAAERESETLWPGTEFTDIHDFATHLSACRMYGSFKSVGEYYATMTSIYIPAAFYDDNNHTVYLRGVAAEYSNYYFTHYKIDDTWYSFSHYYNKASGEKLFNEAKTRYDRRNGAGRATSTDNMSEKHELNGRTVYSWYALGEAYYVWQQDGEYFQMRVNSTPDARLLPLCDMKKMPLPQTSASQIYGGNPRQRKG